MSQRDGVPCLQLFEASPIATIIYRADGAHAPATANRAARLLLTGDDGGSASALAALGEAALAEREPLRRARLTLPHRPDRLFQARALPLDGGFTAVMVEDMTEQFARRAALSIWHDVADQIDDAILVFRVAAGMGPAELEVVASNARAQLLCGFDKRPKPVRMGPALAGIFGEADFDRVAAVIEGRHDAEADEGWSIERGHQAWRCRVWHSEQRLTLRLTDVTQTDHVARALSDHARLLRVANDELDEVAMVLERGVRAPVREACALAQRLDSSVRPGTKGNVSRLNRACEKAERTVDDLLAYVSINRTPLTGGTVDLESVLQRAIASKQALLDARRVRIEHRSMPTIWGQERLLEMLMAHLLEYASRSAPGSGEQVISIHGQRQPSNWRISVASKGFGLDPDYVDSLLRSFDPQQGMSLIICRRIVEHHGGRIGVQAEPAGLVIWFEVPALIATVG